ncbi:MAG: transglycosylase SLT domain-containing protein [Bacteroidia bacterium]|nr:transglycosylase SLT domain-containing protein [Bacteroidia bacterium]
MLPRLASGQAPALFPVEIVTVQHPEHGQRRLVRDPALYRLRCDTLAQPRFWQAVMRLSPDSALVNIADVRRILAVVSLPGYDTLTAERKRDFKDSLRDRYDLDCAASLYVTGGKNHFYRFRDAIPVIDESVPVFLEEGVNPWYAQAILLIESPGQTLRSEKGAYGSFQLMKSVAISMGLTVNKTVDERKDPVKSARAAARFLSRVCIPEAEAIVARHGLAWNRDDLWFRLLVLHVYHAGAANVSGAVGVIRPAQGDFGLIRTLWRTEYGGFKNASQNYSQLALASLLTLDAMIATECEFVCEPAANP